MCYFAVGQRLNFRNRKFSYVAQKHVLTLMWTNWYPLSKSILHQLNCLKNCTSEHAASAQRVLNTVKTSGTFGQRWVDTLQTSCFHWDELPLRLTTVSFSLVSKVIYKKNIVWPYRHSRLRFPCAFYPTFKTFIFCYMVNMPSYKPQWLRSNCSILC